MGPKFGRYNCQLYLSEKKPEGETQVYISIYKYWYNKNSDRKSEEKLKASHH